MRLKLFKKKQTDFNFQNMYKLNMAIFIKNYNHFFSMYKLIIL